MKPARKNYQTVNQNAVRERVASCRAEMSIVGRRYALANFQHQAHRGCVMDAIRKLPPPKKKKITRHGGPLLGGNLILFVFAHWSILEINFVSPYIYELSSI